MWMDAGRPMERVTPLWYLKSLTWGISSRFPLVNHFDLPDSESVFEISQHPPICNMHLSAKMDSTAKAYG